MKVSKHNLLFQPQTMAAALQNNRRNASSTSTANSHNASLHWNIERALAVGLLAIIPGSLILESSATDYLLAASLTLHSHWGLQAIFTDYVHGRTLPKIVSVGLYAISALVFAGLCYFNFNDVGLTKAVKKIWAL
jgi:succinate dehydrogenase (ubiquinone) membrane anchor subunit